MRHFCLSFDAFKAIKSLQKTNQILLKFKRTHGSTLDVLFVLIFCCQMARFSSLATAHRCSARSGCRVSFRFVSVSDPRHWACCLVCIPGFAVLMDAFCWMSFFPDSFLRPSCMSKHVFKVCESQKQTLPGRRGDSNFTRIGGLCWKRVNYWMVLENADHIALGVFKNISFWFMKLFTILQSHLIHPHLGWLLLTWL